MTKAVMTQSDFGDEFEFTSEPNYAHLRIDSTLKLNGSDAVGVKERLYRLMFVLGGDAHTFATSESLTVRAPDAFTLQTVRASLKSTAASTVTFGITQNGTSVLSTQLTIDAGEKTSTTAAVPAVVSITAITNDSELIVTITDDGGGALGAVVTLLGKISLP